MAQSYWLEQRAIRLHNDCFTAEGIDERRLSLFLRYQTTYNRAFHKALTSPIKLQEDRNKAPNGFVSHSKYRQAQHDGFVWQNDALEDPEIGVRLAKATRRAILGPSLAARNRLSYCLVSSPPYGRYD